MTDTSTTTRRRLDPDELARLEEERDFLLGSLRDLEREHDAGDVDDVDYAQLKDDYTRRAADVIRAIDAREVEFTQAPRVGSRRSIGVWLVGLVVIGALAGALIARSSGFRTQSDSVSGDIRTSVRTDLLDAQAALAEARYDEALALYDQVLAVQPSNAEALAYRGWTLVRQGDDAAARPWLDDAVAADPRLPDARVFRAIVLKDAGELELAEADLIAFDESDPPPTMVELVSAQRLREQILAPRLLAAVRDDPSADLSALDAEADDVVAAAIFAAQRALTNEPLEVLRLFDLVLDADPDNVPALSYRAWLIAGSPLGDAPTLLEAAAENLDRAIALDDTYPDAQLWRALTHSRAGEPEAGLIALDRFKSLGPSQELQQVAADLDLRATLEAQLP